LAAKNLHWPALKNLQDLYSVDYVCNRTREKAEELARIIEADTGKAPYITTNPDELHQAKDLDAIDIALPLELNYEHSMKALEGGKHLLLEKPLAQDLKTARFLVEAEKKYPQQVCMVAENFRFRTVYAQLAQKLKDGEIGTPYYAEWRCWQHVDPKTNPYANTNWRLNHVYEGGFITDGGVHNIAALRGLFGELQATSSFVFSANPSIGRTDMISSHFQSEGSDVCPPLKGLFTLGFSAHADWLDQFIIIGTEGSFSLQGSELELRKNKEGRIEKHSHTYPDDGGYSEEFKAFHSLVSEGGPRFSSFSEAYKDLETLLSFLAKSS